MAAILSCMHQNVTDCYLLDDYLCNGTFNIVFNIISFPLTSIALKMWSNAPIQDVCGIARAGRGQQSAAGDHPEHWHIRAY